MERTPPKALADEIVALLDGGWRTDQLLILPHDDDGMLHASPMAGEVRGN